VEFESVNYFDDARTLGQISTRCSFRGDGNSGPLVSA